MIAVHHLDGSPVARLGEFQAHVPRGRALIRREPSPLVTPEAWTFLALEGLPGIRIDRAGAPSVLDHEGGRRPGIERRDEIAGVAPERDRQAAFLRHGE